MPKAFPVSLIIRWRKAATRARDIIYGRTARPLPHAPRYEWSKIVAWYCSRGFMTYRDFFNVAQEMLPGETLGVEGEFDAELDQKLRTEFASRLLVRAKELAEGRTEESREWFRKVSREVRAYTWARQALLDGKCPICARPLESAEPDCHGYRGTKWDSAAMEFVQTVVPEPERTQQ